MTPDHPRAADYEHRALDYEPPLELIRRRLNPSPADNRKALVFVFVVVALGLLLWWSQHAEAQEDPQPGGYPTRHMVCVERADLGTVLADTYGEIPAGMGVSAMGQLIELYVDPNDGSWTIAAVDPASAGRACLIGAGEGWQTAKQAEGVPS